LLFTSILPLFSVFSRVGIDWGKPVPVNPVYLRKGPRVGMGMVAAHTISKFIVSLGVKDEADSMPGSIIVGFRLLVKWFHRFNGK
jgi:hypothetical protein